MSDSREETLEVEQLRIEIAAYSKQILSQALATGAGGNISARHDDLMLISPSGLSLADVTPEQFVAVSISTGAVASSNGLRPSSEVLMHLGCYRRRPDIRAVVHTHPQFTIALSSSGHELRPMFADAIIYLGQKWPHLDYITVTTPELARAVEIKISEANCLVLRNHGAITVGENLKQAFWRSSTLEESARIQLFATLVGKPHFLDAKEADRLESLESETYRRELISQMKLR